MLWNLQRGQYWNKRAKCLSGVTPDNSREQCGARGYDTERSVCFGLAQGAILTGWLLASSLMDRIAFLGWVSLYPGILVLILTNIIAVVRKPSVLS